jgi:hypothetical protein
VEQRIIVAAQDREEKGGDTVSGSR